MLKLKNKPETKFKRGQIAWLATISCGITSYKEVLVLSVVKRRVLLKNESENCSYGPFDVVTGENLRYNASSPSIIYKLFSEKPKSKKLQARELKDRLAKKKAKKQMTRK